MTTTQRKKKIVDELHDYWQLKGLLLRIKRMPSLILNRKYLEPIVHFLDKHTELPCHVFWSELSFSQKVDLAKRFCVVEGHGEKQQMTLSGSKPEIYVVLSGKIDILQVTHSILFILSWILYQFVKLKYWFR